MVELFDPYKTKIEGPVINCRRYYYILPNNEGLLFICSFIQTKSNAYIVPRYLQPEWMKSFLDRTRTRGVYEDIKKQVPGVERDDIFVEEIDSAEKTLADLLNFMDSPYYCEEPQMVIPYEEES